MPIASSELPATVFLPIAIPPVSADALSPIAIALFTPLAAPSALGPIITLPPPVVIVLPASLPIAIFVKPVVNAEPAP